MVKSKETVGNSWTVLKVILGHKYHHKHTEKNCNLRTLSREAANIGTKEALIIIIIMYIYHALINALSAHMIHINLNMIFYTHVKHSPTKTIYIKCYLK